MLVAWLIERYFGSAFSLGRLPCVLGLVAAAIVGPAVSGIGGTLIFMWLHEFDGTGPDHLVSLVHCRRTRHSHGCAAFDWPRLRGARSAAAQ